MAKKYEKIEPNIYYDERCAKNPYCVGMSVDGERITGSFPDLETARAFKNSFRKMVDKDHKPLLRLPPDQTKHIPVIKAVKKVLKDAGHNKYVINEFVYDAVKVEDYDQLIEIVKRYVILID